MRAVTTILNATLILVASGARCDATAQEGETPNTGDAIESARPYLEITCKHLASTNPRVRYSAREALRNFAAQAKPLVKAAQADAKDPHVRAFLARTLNYLSRVLPRARSRKGGFEKARHTRKSRPPYDIDRVANAISLTFAQIARLDPILRRHFKDVRALWATMREAGSMKDKRAHRDLNDEITRLVQEAAPKLRAFLDAKQTEYVLSLMRRARTATAGPDLPPHLTAWYHDLTERWEARDSLSEEERKELMQEWGEFKRQASGK